MSFSSSACRRLFALAALMLFGGCTETMTQAYMYRSGIQTSFAYAAGGRDMAVVVVGNPFKVPKEALDRVVIDSMQGRNRPPATNFTTTPGESSRPGYRIVVVLNPSTSFDSHDACGNAGAIPTGPADGRLRALMVFCAKDIIYSEVKGSIPAVEMPTEGGFRALIGALTMDIVPEREPNSDNEVPLPRSAIEGAQLAVR